MGGRLGSGEGWALPIFASVTGSMTPPTYNECNPQHPTPVLQIHGTADAVVAYEGAPGWSESIPDVLDYWSTYNNCNPTPSITPIPDIDTTDGTTVEHHVWAEGENGTTTEHFKVFGGGHDWPGAFGNMDILANVEIWKFFMRFDINGAIHTSTNSIEEVTGEKTLEKIVDMLGRETIEQPNQLLFYIYSDGTTEKRYRNE